METNENSRNKIIRFCKVLRVEGGSDGATEYGGLRIKVRLDPEDGTILNDDDLPYVFPLMPKLVHVNPKVGETVMVVLSDPTAPQGQRLFIGPVISQPYFNNMSFHDTTSMAMLNGRQLADPEHNPFNNPANKGTLPDRDDIAILGRLNSDIILKEKEIRLRVGAKKNPKAFEPLDRLVFNDVDLGYIQMKYDNFTVNGNNFRSVINVVADRINLLSYDSPDFFNMTDREQLISNAEIYKILQKAHPIIYGDLFMDFMDKFLTIFKTHTHPFPMKEPVFNGPDSSTLATDLQKFLSKSIRAN